MAVETPVSVFCSVLPSTNSREGKTIASRLGRDGLNLKIAEFISLIIEQSVNALIDGKYKQFDALRKDFGCQITALELQQTIQKPSILEEALTIQKLFQEQFRTGEILVSQDFASLIRNRLLCIINSNKLEGGVEKPYTNIESLQAMAPEIATTTLKTFVLGIQIDDSMRATRFIRENAQLLPESASPRIRLIKRLLAEDKVRFSRSKIASLPLVYNTEAVLRRCTGPVLIKNKLLLGEEPIVDAEEIKLFIDPASNRILGRDEVEALPDKLPIIVIEGFIKKGEERLRETLATVGLITLVNANCAQHPQYASMTDQRAIDDQEAQEDLASYQNLDWIQEVINIDHIFCNSVGEER